MPVVTGFARVNGGHPQYVGNVIVNQEPDENSKAMIVLAALANSVTGDGINVIIKDAVWDDGFRSMNYRGNEYSLFMSR